MDSASTLPLIRQLRPIFAELPTSTRETLSFIVPKLEYILDEEKDALFHRNLPRTPLDNVRVFPNWLNQQLSNLFSSPASYVAGVEVLRALLNVEYIDLNEKTKFFSSLLMRCIFEAHCYEDSVMAAEVWGLMINNGSSVVEGIIEDSLIYSIQLLKDDDHDNSSFLTTDIAASNMIRVNQTSSPPKNSTSFGAQPLNDGPAGRLIGSAKDSGIDCDESMRRPATEDNNHNHTARTVNSHVGCSSNTDMRTGSRADLARQGVCSHESRRGDDGAGSRAADADEANSCSNRVDSSHRMHRSGGGSIDNSDNYHDTHNTHSGSDDYRHRRLNSTRVSKLSGCIIIQQLVRRMPSSVVPHLDRILDGLQRAVIDANDKVRLCAVDALYHILRIAYRSVDRVLYEAWQDTLVTNCVRALSYDDYCVLHGCLMTFNALLSSVTTTDGACGTGSGSSASSIAGRGRVAITAAPASASAVVVSTTSSSSVAAAAAAATNGTAEGSGSGSGSLPGCRRYFSATSTAHIDHAIRRFIQTNLLPGTPMLGTPSTDARARQYSPPAEPWLRSRSLSTGMYPCDSTLRNGTDIATTGPDHGDLLSGRMSKSGYNSTLPCGTAAACASSSRPLCWRAEERSLSEAHGGGVDVTCTRMPAMTRASATHVVATTTAAACGTDAATATATAPCQDVAPSVCRRGDAIHLQLRQAILDSLPLLAKYDVTAFKQTIAPQLNRLMYTVFHKPNKTTAVAGSGYSDDLHLSERPALFLVMARLMSVLPELLSVYVEKMMRYIKSSLTPRPGWPRCPQAVTSFAMLSAVNPDAVRPYLRYMLPLLFADNMSDGFASAIAQICAIFPELRSTCLSKVLEMTERRLLQIRRQHCDPFAAAGPTPSRETAGAAAASLSCGLLSAPPAVSRRHEMQDSVLNNLTALTVLDFTGYSTLHFLCDAVVPYVSNAHEQVRRAAIDLCFRLVFSVCAQPPCQRSAAGVITHHGHDHIRLVNTVVKQLIAAAVADLESDIRLHTLKRFTPAFDATLALPDFVQAFYPSLHDKHQNRVEAVRLLGRLSPRNPACIYPMLKSVMMKAAMDIRFFHVPRSQEQATRVLSAMVESAPDMMRAYMPALLRDCATRLQRKSDEVPILTALLACLGKLARYAEDAEDVAVLTEVRPRVIEHILDSSSIAKKQEAIRALTDIIRTTREVSVYETHPQLLRVLLSALHGGFKEVWPVRLDVLKLIGVVGAVDPARIKELSRELRDRGVLELHHRDPVGWGALSRDGAGVNARAAVSGEETIARSVIKQVLLVLQHPSLTDEQCTRAIEVWAGVLSLREEMTSGEAMAAYYGEIARTTLTHMTTRPKIRGKLLVLLSDMVRYFGSHIRSHVDMLIPALLQFLPTEDPTLLDAMLRLMAHLRHAFGNEFVRWIPDLLQPIIQVLLNDPARLGEPVFHFFIAMGTLLSHYLHTVLPFVCDVASNPAYPMPSRVAAVRAMAHFAHRLPHLVYHISQCVHCLCTILKEMQPVALHEAMRRRWRADSHSLRPTATAPSARATTITDVRKNTSSNHNHNSSSNNNSGSSGSTHTGTSAATSPCAVRRGGNNPLLLSSSACVEHAHDPHMLIAITLDALREVARNAGEVMEKFMHLVFAVLQPYGRDGAEVRCDIDAVVRVSRHHRAPRLVRAGDCTQYLDRYHHRLGLGSAARSHSHRYDVRHSSRNSRSRSRSRSSSSRASHRRRGAERNIVGRGAEETGGQSSLPRRYRSGGNEEEVRQDAENHSCGYAARGQNKDDSSAFDPYRGSRSHPSDDPSSPGNADASNHNHSSNHPHDEDTNGCSSSHQRRRHHEKDATHATSSSHPPPLANDSGYYTTSNTTRRGRAMDYYAQLHTVLDVRERETEEDWNLWLKQLSVELLRLSPSPSHRFARTLAHIHEPFARHMLHSAFAVCYAKMDTRTREMVIGMLEAVLRRARVPSEVLHDLLDLAEYMERLAMRFGYRDGRPNKLDYACGLLFSLDTLIESSERCNSYAKALHYVQIKFHMLTYDYEQSVVRGRPVALPQEQWRQLVQLCEKSIYLCNLLGQRESAEGILKYIQLNFPYLTGKPESEMTRMMDAQLFEKLQWWSQSLRAYQIGLQQDPHNLANMVGLMRSLDNLGDYAELLHVWNTYAPRLSRKEMGELAPYGAHAAWLLRRWDDMERITAFMSEDGYVGTTSVFYQAVSAVYRREYHKAGPLIERCRRMLDADVSALVAESYDRAYHIFVGLQQLSELEEFALAAAAGQHHLGHWQDLWERRLSNMAFDGWGGTLANHTLIIAPARELPMWINFVALARLNAHERTSQEVLYELLGCQSIEQALRSTQLPLPAIALAASLHMYDMRQREQALALLQQYVDTVERTVDVKLLSESSRASFAQCHVTVVDWSFALARKKSSMVEEEPVAAAERTATPTDNTSREDMPDTRGSHPAPNTSMCREWGCNPHSCRVGSCPCRCNCARSRNGSRPSVPDHASVSVWGAGERVSVKAGLLAHLPRATTLDPGNGALWHTLARLYHSLVPKSDPTDVASKASYHDYILRAMSGYVRSMCLSHELEDVLGFLSLWFMYGSLPCIQGNLALQADVLHVSPTVWLKVIPQIIARIHSRDRTMAESVYRLLINIAKAHPQALLYSLNVMNSSLLGSDATPEQHERRRAAQRVLDDMAEMHPHGGALVGEANMVCHELVRCAVLWIELWFDALERAWYEWGRDRQADGVLAMLHPLLEKMKTPHTMAESQFVSDFGELLYVAHEAVSRAAETGNPSYMDAAWGYFKTAVKCMDERIANMTSLELQVVSLRLVQQGNDLSLVVPGQYNKNGIFPRIASFQSTLKVMNSKQHPRRLYMNGSDGEVYKFLLKGHEDLRLDERVMQLLAFVNTLLEKHSVIQRRNGMIQIYSVTPLSDNAGLVGWVDHCDTLHHLIKERRITSKNLSVEVNLMRSFNVDLDRLTTIQHMEPFEFALEHTDGNDIANSLRVRAHSAESWLDRRTTYVCSLATMSMVGHVLGLGDRHPSNLMIHAFSGRVVHIDFGDCFDVAKTRSLYPEKVPFRLTRMLVKAMEIGGIEGLYRHGCISVMSTLREEGVSILALLEAFVHDPLVSWWRDESDAEAEGTDVARDDDSVWRQTAPEGAATEAGATRDATGHAACTSSMPTLRETSTMQPSNAPTSMYSANCPPSLPRVYKDMAQSFHRRPSAVGSVHPARMSLQTLRHSVARRARGARASLAATLTRTVAPTVAAKSVSEILRNEANKAQKVVRRIKEKLEGREFLQLAAMQPAHRGELDGEEGLKVETQVARLIEQATSTENLCVHYQGWCPFW